MHERKIKLFIATLLIILVLVGIVFYVIIQRQSTETPIVEELPKGFARDEPFVSPVPHPGKIKVKNLIHNTTQEVDAELSPIEGRFVFFKDGKEVSYKENFDEVIPIVETEIMKDFTVKQYGEGHRLLRTTTRDQNSQSDPAIQPPLTEE